MIKLCLNPRKKCLQYIYTAKYYTIGKHSGTKTLEGGNFFICFLLSFKMARKTPTLKKFRAVFTNEYSQVMYLKLKTKHDKR